jgi:hypothetical protein
MGEKALAEFTEEVERNTEPNEALRNYTYAMEDSSGEELVPSEAPVRKKCKK